MKICFLTFTDPEDKTSWSGIYYQMYSNLKKHHQVEWIGAVKFKLSQRVHLKAKNLFYKILKRTVPTHNVVFSSYYARNVKKRLDKNKYDIIYAPVASRLICFLETSVPIVYLSDATFQLMINYYPEFTGLSKKNISNGNLIEKNALQKSYKVIFSSEWAKNSAIEFYRTPPEKISVFDFGANLLYEPTEAELDFSHSDTCNILFLGVKWVRKGGDTAYKTYLQLKNKGLPCTFTIIGCDPALTPDDPNVKIIPFLNKNDTKDFDTLFKILLQTHILLLPTKADCSPIVFSEASAFGIPSITRNTGGISSVVKNGINGYLLDIDADENDFCNKIYSIFNNPDSFKQLRINSRKEYEKRLSWKKWTENFNRFINE